MAFSVGTLTNYVKEFEGALVTSSLFSAKTQELIVREGNVLTAVKSSQTIDIMDTDAYFQDDSGCGFNASGTTSFTQRTVTVGKLKLNEDLCLKTLETKATQKLLPTGSDYDKIPFEQAYTDRKAGLIAEALEVALWQADLAGSAGTNGIGNKFDGLIKLLNAASGVTVFANTTGFINTVVTGFTSSNILDAVDATCKAVPARVKGKSDIRVFIGWDLFELYVQGLKNQNLFNFGSPTVGEGEINIPGFGYKLTAVHGLDSQNKIYVMRMSNIHLGVDIEGEENEFKMWYSLDFDTVRFKARFKLGVNVAFPNEVAIFKI
jgi:hypothetical protein